MKLIIKFLLIIVVSLNSSNLYADLPYILNFKYILNNSEAGKKAQNFLKKKLEDGLKNIRAKINITVEISIEPRLGKNLLM